MPVRFVDRSVVLAASSVGSVVVAGALVRFGPGPASVLAALPVAVALTSQNRYRPLMLALLLVLALPPWWALGTAQLEIFRIAAALAVLSLLLGQVRYRPALPDAFLAAYVGVSFLSSISQTDVPDIGQLFLNNALIPLAFYVAARLLPVRMHRRALTTVVIAISIGALSVIAELITGYTLFRDPSQYSWVLENGGIFRPGGVFGSPPAASLALVAGILIALALRAGASGSQRLFLSGSVGIEFVALVATFERVAIIALSVGFAVYLLQARGGTVSVAKAALTVTAITAVALVAFPNVTSTTAFRNGVLRGGENTFAARVTLWQDALEVTTSSAATTSLGLGFGSWISARDLENVPQALLARPALLANSIHNQYLLIFLEQGAVGLMLFVVFLGSALWTGIRAAVQSNDRISAALASCILAIAIQAVTNTPVLDRGSWILAMFIVGLSVARARPPSRIPAHIAAGQDSREDASHRSRALPPMAAPRLMDPRPRAR